LNPLCDQIHRHSSVVRIHALDYVSLGRLSRARFRFLLEANRPQEIRRDAPAVPIFVGQLLDALMQTGL
jgi:hypothetical protein